MVFKQTSKGKEEKLVVSAGGSLPIVEYPKCLVITCLKREEKKTQLGMFKKLKRPERMEQAGGKEGRGEKRWPGQATVRGWESGPSGVLF